MWLLYLCMVHAYTFYRAAWNADAVLRWAFCLSVRLSVRRMRGLWQNERKISRDFYTIWKIIYLSFLRKRMVGGVTPSTWNFGSTGPRWSEIADFEPIIARSASAVTPSEKRSVNTNRKSTTRFPMSLRWSPYLAPKYPKGCSKTQKGRFSYKIALRVKKVCYKVYSCENCQQQSCRAFIGLSMQKLLVRTSPSTCNFGSNWQCWSEIADFRSVFARSVSAVTPREKVQLSLIGSPLRAFQ